MSGRVHPRSSCGRVPGLVRRPRTLESVHIVWPFKAGEALLPRPFSFSGRVSVLIVQAAEWLEATWLRRWGRRRPIARTTSSPAASTSCPFGRDRRFGPRVARLGRRRARRLERQPDRDAHVGRAARSHRQRQPVELERHRSSERRRRLAAGRSDRRALVRHRGVRRQRARSPSATRRRICCAGRATPTSTSSSASRSASRTRVTADLRFESFNATNRVNFGNPNTQLGNPSFGADLVRRFAAQQPGRREAAVLT